MTDWQAVSTSGVQEPVVYFHSQVGTEVQVVTTPPGVVPRNTGGGLRGQHGNVLAFAPVLAAIVRRT